MEKVKQIPVKDNNKEYRRLINYLYDKDYNILYYLKDIKDDDSYVALVVDIEDKKVFSSNVTCMAAWCSGKRKPLNVKEFIDNYDEIVIQNNIDKYNDMILDKTRRD